MFQPPQLLDGNKAKLKLRRTKDYNDLLKIPNL